MKLMVIILLLVSITLAGCSNVRTYTFKKERVDQRVEGNRGYLMGTPPPAPVIREVPKRTLIGIDIEIPILPGEEVKSSTKEKTIAEERVVVKEEVVLSEPARPAGRGTVVTTVPEPKKESAAQMVEETVEEEEWIK